PHKHTAHTRDLPSFPTRRSSDLAVRVRAREARLPARAIAHRRREHLQRVPVPPPGARVATGPRALAARPPADPPLPARRDAAPQDRKSTRLNSSHGSISYAVFCL